MESIDIISNPSKSSLESPEPICRICHESINPGDNGVAKPCKCTNYIHYACYNAWKISESNKKDPDTCDICLTRYKTITITSKFDWETAKERWLNIIFCILMFPVLCIGYLWDLTYFKNYHDGQPLNYLLPFHQIAVLLSFTGTLVLIDAIYCFSTREDGNWPSYLGLQFKMILLKNHRVLRNLYGGTIFLYLILFLTIGGIIGPAVSSAIGNNHPNSQAFLGCGVVLMIICMVSSIIAIHIYSEYIAVKSLPERNGFSKFWIIPLLFLGQILCHVIGYVTLKYLPQFPGETWNYIVQSTFTGCNVFTHAYGTCWILGGLFIIYLIHYVLYCTLTSCFSYICPRIEEKRLAEYNV